MANIKRGKKQAVIGLPIEVLEWLKRCGERNAGTVSSELTRMCRREMAMEAAQPPRAA